MPKTEKIKPYKKEHETTYTSGAYATLELLKTRPELAEKVYIHSSYHEKEALLAFCKGLGIPAAVNDCVFTRINQKENAYVVGVFRKYDNPIHPLRPHIVLVNPSDMGNLGTIIRMMAGFHLMDLAVILPGADAFHPKTIRASMGALFHMRLSLFDCFESYRALFPDHGIYPFMLDGEPLSQVLAQAHEPLFALLFGNEARGLDPGFAFIGKPVKIPQSPLVDSLNVSIAAGIGAYAFAHQYGII